MTRPLSLTPGAGPRACAPGPALPIGGRSTCDMIGENEVRSFIAGHRDEYLDLVPSDLWGAFELSGKA